MPFNPQAVGDKLVAVGESQIKTGNKLKHSATELRGMATSLQDNGRVDTALGSIEAGTRSTRDLLTPIAAALHSVANALNSISVPSVDFDTRTLDLGPVGRVRVVTGVSVSSSRPFRGIGGSIEAVADDLDNVRGALREIAGATRSLQDELPHISARVLGGADDLEQGGSDLITAGTVIKEAGHLLAGV